MDKIKLYSKQKNLLPKKIIDNEFKYVGHSYGHFNDNTKHKYVNEHVGLTIDKFGLQLVANPTSYLKANNIIQINRNELGEFKERFESDLHTNTDNYTLTGFDYNVDIKTDYPVGSYLSSLNLLPRYKKEIYPSGNGITYSNKCKSFTVYDKFKQMEEASVCIPSSCSNTNLMRLELGVNSRLNKSINLSKIGTLRDLIQKDNYISMIDEFEHIYGKIHKQPLHKFINLTKPHPSVMSTVNFAFVYYINEIGLDNYYNSLDQEMMMKIISKKTRKTRKDKAIKLWNQYSTLDKNVFDLLAEMSNKVIKQIQVNKEAALT